MDRLRPHLSAARARRRAVGFAALTLALSFAGPSAAGPGAAKSPAAPVAPKGGGTPAQDAPTSDAARARELHNKGRKAYQAGDLPAAYEAYSAAWALQKSFDVAANLAAVEIATARFRDAAEHLAFALANLPVSGDADKQRPALQGLLADAKKHLCTFTIKVNVDGAAVTLDGRALGPTPIRDEVFVEPGDHLMSVTAPTYAPLDVKVHAEKGAAREVPLNLKKIATGPLVTGPSPVTIAGFVTAGLGLAAGTALAIVSKTKADDADTQQAALQTQGAAACGGARPAAACVSLHDARAARDTFANAALWTFVGAGAVTAGTLVYTFVVPRLAAPKPTGVSAVPVVSPQGAGLLVRGSF
jgi:hypothetical protein